MSVFVINEFVKVRVDSISLTTEELDWNEDSDEKKSVVFAKGEIFLVRSCIKVLTTPGVLSPAYLEHVSLLHSSGIYWENFGKAQYAFEKL